MSKHKGLPCQHTFNKGHKHATLFLLFFFAYAHAKRVRQVSCERVRTVPCACNHLIHCFPVEGHICPRHRDLFGIYWRCNKKMCSTPTDWAPHKSKKLKGDHGLTFLQSKGLHQLTNQLLHVGTRKKVLIFRKPYSTHSL